MTVDIATFRRGDNQITTIKSRFLLINSREFRIKYAQLEEEHQCRFQFRVKNGVFITKNDKKSLTFRPFSPSFLANFTTQYRPKSPPPLHLSFIYEYVVYQNRKTHDYAI